MTDPDPSAEIIDAKVDEILPPGAVTPGTENHGAAKSTGSFKRLLPRVVARLLDEFISIPNSNIKIGLDPIIGFFFPAVGDAITATLGTTILLEGARRQLPKSVLVRMATNIAINAAVGSIPILGDVFSVWFKSNAQNNALLERHSGNPDHPKVRPSLWPLLLFLVGVFGIIALVVLGLVFLFQALF